MNLIDRTIKSIKEGNIDHFRLTFPHYISERKAAEMMKDAQGSLGFDHILTESWFKFDEFYNRISDIDSSFLLIEASKKINKAKYERYKSNQEGKGAGIDGGNKLGKDAARKRAARKASTDINGDEVGEYPLRKFNRIRATMDIERVKLASKGKTPIIVNGSTTQKLMNINKINVNKTTIKDYINTHDEEDNMLNEGENKKRRAARQKEYNARPEQIKRRASRVMARRKMEDRGLVWKGDGKDIDHKNGNPRDNSQSNLRVMASGKNRGRNNNESIDYNLASNREFGTSRLLNLYRQQTPGQ